MDDPQQPADFEADPYNSVSPTADAAQQADAQGSYDPQQYDQQQYDPQQYDQQQYDPQQYDQQQYDPQQYDQQQYDPQQYDQQQYDQQQYDPQQYDPQQYDPQQYDPQQYDPQQYDQQQYDQQQYDQQQYDPQQYDQQQYDPQQYDQQQYDPQQYDPQQYEQQQYDQQQYDPQQYDQQQYDQQQYDQQQYDQQQYDQQQYDPQQYDPQHDPVEDEAAGAQAPVDAAVDFPEPAAPAETEENVHFPETETKAPEEPSTPAPEEEEGDPFLAYVLEQLQLEATTLAQYEAEQEQAYTQAVERLNGISFAIHPRTRMLYIQDFLTDETLALIPIFAREVGLFDDSDPPELNIEHWDKWGSALCYVDPNQSEIVQIEAVDQDYLYGLVLTDSTPFMYTRNPMETQLLGVSYECMYHRVHKGGVPNHAYDMVLSEDCRYLCICDREMGRVILISTETRSEIGQVQIRAPGSSRAINVAFDYYEPKVFFTDSQSAQLFCLNLENLELEKVPLDPTGLVFGNIVRSPDIRYIFMLSLNEGASLHQINIESGEFEEELKLKGQFFSHQQIDPADLMVLSPDQSALMVVSSHNDPAPYTPYITVIDPHSLEVQHSYVIPDAIRDQKKPAALVFPLENPILNCQKSPYELLIEKGHLSPEKLQALQTAFNAQEVEAGVPEEALTQLDLGDGNIPALVPRVAQHITLDPEKAVAAIVNILSQKLYQQSEIDLDDHPAEKERFRERAEEYRQSLEDYDSVEVLIEEILEEHRFETLLTRQEVMSFLTGNQKLAVRPPQHCPSCEQALKGQWDCPTCGLELDNPTRAKKKKRSSMTTLGAVARFHILLTDTARQRLVLLDDNKTIDWELKAEDLPFPTPWSALWINKQRLLIVDREASQVYECAPGGSQTWILSQKDPELQLQNPVKASYFKAGFDDHFLIVDQGNHRVLVVSRKNKIIWQYGEMGVAGSGPGQLNQPSDLQLTFDGTYLIADTGNHRVIEIDGEDILRSFGPAQGLKSPIYAQRLHDNDTLIIDAGHYRAIELDPEGELTRETLYYTDEIGDELRIDQPIQVYRREKRSIVLMDQDKIIEIAPLKKMLIWSSLLEHLARRVEIQMDAFSTRENYIMSFNEHRLPTIEELLDRLREANRLSSSSGIAEQIYANLESLIEQRRERDRQRPKTAVVKHLSVDPLMPIAIYLIDRTNQQVVQLNRDGEAHWYFGTDTQYKLRRPTHVAESPKGLLIADTANNRVLEVSHYDQEVIQVIGSKEDTLLNLPRSVTRTQLGNWLISDQGNKRLVEMNAEGEVLWSYNPAHDISHPFYAEELGKGTILFVDWGLQMVKEITRSGELIWSYGQSRWLGDGDNHLMSPEYATRLRSGSILIADTGNHRIIEVSPIRRILWEFRGSKQYELYQPNFCQRLRNGNTLIAYNNYRHMLEVNRDGEACWYFELGNDALVSVAHSLDMARRRQQGA